MNKRDSRYPPAPFVTIPPLFRVARRVVAVPVAVVGRIPFSLVMIGLVLLIAYRTGTIHGGLDHRPREEWGYDLENIRHGHLWVLVTSEVMTGYPAHVHNTVWMLIAWLVPFEAVAGTGRALAAYWASTLFATGAAAIISVLLIHGFGWDRSPDLISQADVGASVGAWGVAGALSVWLVWRGSGWTVAGLTFPIGGMVYLGHILVTRWGISDIAHPIGLATGLAVGTMILQPVRHGHPTNDLTTVRPARIRP